MLFRVKLTAGTDPGRNNEAKASSSPPLLLFFLGLLKWKWQIKLLNLFTQCGILFKYMSSDNGL